MDVLQVDYMLNGSRVTANVIINEDLTGEIQPQSPRDRQSAVVVATCKLRP